MQALEFFKLLSDETRLHSVLLIAAQGELCVCELTAALQLTQPKISRHLAMLRKAELLLDRRQGQWVFYRLNPALPDFAVQSIRQTLRASGSMLQPLQQQLAEMADRPQRDKVCCE